MMNIIFLINILPNHHRHYHRHIICETLNFLSTDYDLRNTSKFKFIFMDPTNLLNVREDFQWPSTCFLVNTWRELRGKVFQSNLKIPYSQFFKALLTQQTKMVFMIFNPWRPELRIFPTLNPRNVNKSSLNSIGELKNIWINSLALN